MFAVWNARRGNLFLSRRRWGCEAGADLGITSLGRFIQTPARESGVFLKLRRRWAIESRRASNLMWLSRSTFGDLLLGDCFKNGGMTDG